MIAGGQAVNGFVHFQLHDPRFVPQNQDVTAKDSKERRKVLKGILVLRALCVYFAYFALPLHPESGVTPALLYHDPDG
jgi:hypothetical protein